MTKTIINISILIFLLLFVDHQLIYAQTIGPDTTFNGTGIKVFTFNNNIDRSYGCALQADQKLVLAGLSKSGSYFQLCFARLNIDGSFDSTFHGTGFSYVPMGPQQSIGGQTPAIKITPDGKITAVNAGAGPSGNSLDMMVCRLDSNGYLDNTFNSNGVLFIDMLGSGTQPDILNALDIDANGNIYAVGATRTGGTPLDNDFALVKITSSGVLDPSFDGDGKKLFDPTGFAEFGRGIKVLDNGKIVFGGTAQGNMMIAMMDSTGALDTAFNSTGFVSVNFGNQSDMMALDNYTDGRIVVSGTKSSSTSDIAVARYLSNGLPDANFGTNGKASFNPTLSDEFVTSMILMDDNRILLGGYASNGSSGTDFMAARIDTTGIFDTTFNNTGYIIKNTVPGGTDEEGNGLALMDDGRIIICGTAVYSSAVNEDVSVLRLTNVTPVSTGIFSLSTDSKFITYPNPCQENIFIRSSQPGKYILTDLSGRILNQFTFNTGQHSINMKSLENGAYLIKNIDTGNIFRIIKM